MEEINKRSGSGAIVSLILCLTDGMESNSTFRCSYTSTNPCYCASCCMDVAEGRIWISGNTVNRTEGVAHELLGVNKVPSDALSQRKPWQVTVLAVCGKEEGLGSPAAVRGTAGCGCWQLRVLAARLRSQCGTPPRCVWERGHHNGSEGPGAAPASHKQRLLRPTLSDGSPEP